MKRITQAVYLFLMLAFAGLTIVLNACESEELVEPYTFTPNQIRRLILSDSTKLWQQSSGYYLEDSCRTGYYLRFSHNATKDATKPFFAYFYRDTTVCEAGEELYLRKEVSVPKSPALQTTDSLRFVGAAGDTTIRLIRLLTSQHMQLDLVDENGVVQREVYQAVEEVE